MPSESGFLDEQGMLELARKAIEDLRTDGISPTELKRLESVLRDGGVGEALMLASLLRTIRGEISPDASQQKLLEIYRILEECTSAFVELSRRSGNSVPEASMVPASSERILKKFSKTFLGASIEKLMPTAGPIRKPAAAN